MSLELEEYHSYVVFTCASLTFFGAAALIRIHGSARHFLLIVPIPQHGRIAMLAILGLIVPEFVRVPGDIYQNVSVLDAHNAMVSTHKLKAEFCFLVLVESSFTGYAW